MTALAYFIVSGVTQRNGFVPQGAAARARKRAVRVADAPGRDWCSLRHAPGRASTWSSPGSRVRRRGDDDRHRLPQGGRQEGRGASGGTPSKRRKTMLKTMRLHGLDEDALRQFVCKYSGALLGGVLRDALRVRGQNGRPRSLGTRRARSTPPRGSKLWRDPIVRWIDGQTSSASAKHARRRLLQKIEEKSLEARGVNLLDRPAPSASGGRGDGHDGRRDQGSGIGMPHAVRGERIAIGQAAPTTRPPNPRWCSTNASKA